MMRRAVLLSALLFTLLSGPWVGCSSSTRPPDPAAPSGPTQPTAAETPDIPGPKDPPAPAPVPVVTSPGDAPSVGLPLGTEAPAFALKLMNPDKKRAQLTLADHVGKGAKDPKKGVLLSFAASYCGPCKKELADLAKAEGAWRRAGLLTAVVVIDTDDAGIEAMRAFLLDELKLPFPVLADRFAILARRYRADALPYVVLVDAAGKIRWSHAGYDPAGLKEVLAKLP